MKFNNYYQMKNDYKIINKPCLKITINKFLNALKLKKKKHFQLYFDVVENNCF